MNKPFTWVYRALCLAALTASAVVAEEYYVAPNGDENNPGTQSLPTSLNKALSQVQSGDAIYLKGGSYNFSESIVIQTSGTENAPIHFFAVEGETPIINFSAMEENSSNRGVVLDADYWHFKGIIIEEAGDNGMLLAGNHNTIERCVFRRNHDSGLQLSRYNTDHDDISQWPSHNLILRCESYDNRDSDNEDADGFAPKLTTGEGNVFRHCVSHHNIDDGWDLYAKTETGPIGVVTLENCIAHSNGRLTDGVTSGNGDKNGFKLGSSGGILVNHIVRRCIAFNNGKHGFTDNGNTSSIEFSNNTAWNNADYNFHTRDGANHVFKNNISFGGGHTDRIVGDVSYPNALTEDDMEWDFTAGEADFISLTPGPDANPTENGFLQLNPASPLVNAGIQTSGIEFEGSAPDLGALEHGMTTRITIRQAGKIRLMPSAHAIAYDLRGKRLPRKKPTHRIIKIQPRVENNNH